MLGIERSVVVQSTCHGFDNDVIADVIAARGGAYCGIALAPVTVSDASLRRLHAQGFRGLRFNFMKHLGAATPIEQIIGITPRLAALGWQLRVHFPSTLVNELAPSLLHSATPVVIDHMGRIDASQGLDQPAFRKLCGLMEDPRMWVKVSGSDRISREGPPYADAVPFARALVERFGDRTLWAPTGLTPTAMACRTTGPVDLLAQIAPSAASRRALLVDNPQRLYRFPVSLAAARSAPESAGRLAPT